MKQSKPNITVPETQSPNTSPEHYLRHLHLSQHHSFSNSSSDGTQLTQLQRSCPTSHNEDDMEQHCGVSENCDGNNLGDMGTSTTTTADIPNAQPEKYQGLIHDESQSSQEMEDTYVDYRVTQVQGGGDIPVHSSTSVPVPPKTSVDGAYSLVANSLKLSTV